jgi:uncharacterized protein (DUF1778 family)
MEATGTPSSVSSTAMSTVPQKRHLALRISVPDLELIEQLATERGLNRTDYMVRASTGDLHDSIDLDARFAAIEGDLMG